MQAEQRKKLSPLKKEVAKLEKKINDLEQKIELIEIELAKPEMYEIENRLEVEKLSKQRVEMKIDLDHNEELWIQKSEVLEELNQAIT